jgi:hypothetical protein
MSCFASLRVPAVLSLKVSSIIRFLHFGSMISNSAVNVQRAAEVVGPYVGRDDPARRFCGEYRPVYYTP